MTKIIENKIQCKHCGKIISSLSRHHYVKCDCGRVAVDGGKDYLRRAFYDKSDYIELSVVEDE